jgi:hypothetical protein
MEGKITIELRTDHTPDSGSGLPDRGHDAYWLKKTIPTLRSRTRTGRNAQSATSTRSSA